MKKRIFALGMGIILLSFGLALTGCSRDPRLVGRWERTNVVNTPLGIVVANEVEFFSDGTGRLRLDDFMRGHSEAFTWSSGSGRIRMEFSGSFIFSSQIHDYELSGSDLTFIYDRATNFHAVFRRAR